MADARPGPLEVLAKLPARVRARGWKEVGGLLLGRVKENISSHEGLVFFSRPTSSPDPEPQPASGLELKRATVSDGDGYARDIGTDSPTTFAHRLDPGTRCYLVVDDGKVLHASWVTTTAAWVREIRRYFRPPQGDAYVYESFTRADARGRGVYPFALRAICRELAADGVTTLWVAVEAHNEPSLRAVAKAGFEEGFRLDYGRKLGRLEVSAPKGQKAELCATCFARKLVE